jgi:hypothetical protein
VAIGDGRDLLGTPLPVEQLFRKPPHNTITFKGKQLLDDVNSCENWIHPTRDCG